MFVGFTAREPVMALVESLGLDASRVGRLEIDGREIRAEVLTDTKVCRDRNSPQYGQFPTEIRKFLIGSK
ncbi:hypothetical protein ACFWC6_32195 [Micromonospora chalcea]